MNYSMMELVWLLLIYSFLGWVVETIVGTVKKKKFVNRGFSTGPFCLVYGIAAVFMAVTMEELMAEPVFQLIGCGVLATIIEWMAGKILERLNQHKWWDYSNKKWNFDGYICLQYSVLWAVLGFVAVRYGDAFFLIVYHMIPTLIREILLWILLAGMALDISASLAAVFHIRKEMPTAIRWNKKVAVWTQKFALMIVGHVEKRMAKAYPVIMEKTEQIEKEGNFAEGCGFYKLFWLFLIGAVLGDFTETIFCRLTAGVWMSRSSLVWGPFSIVWGFAFASVTQIDPVEALALKRRIDKSNQDRTDLVELIDSYFLDKYKEVKPLSDATINTESPAWAIDRLSILALKIYHMQQEVERTDTTEEHRAQCQTKLNILLEQRKDLSTAIEQLLADIEAGRKYMKVYKQMKMYNDPALNPVLYAKK